eukprot:g82463.t1
MSSEHIYFRPTPTKQITMLLFAQVFLLCLSFAAGQQSANPWAYLTSTTSTTTSTAPACGVLLDYLDFAASAPGSYDHSQGGGAYNDATEGSYLDIARALSGEDFCCNDRVTFLTQVANTNVERLQLRYRFDGYRALKHAALNFGLVVNGDNGTGVNAPYLSLGYDSGSTMGSTISSANLHVVYQEVTAALPFTNERGNSVCRRSTGLSTDPRDVVRFEAEDLMECQQPCSALGAACAGVEYDEYTKRCELWLVSIRSSPTRARDSRRCYVRDVPWINLGDHVACAAPSAGDNGEHREGYVMLCSAMFCYAMLVLVTTESTVKAMLCYVLFCAMLC